jgi:NSS family neurotransmitter:Na+ symporter
MPQLFQMMPAGGFFMIVFFLALSFAALTSLISMVELVSRILMDAGLDRRRAVTVVGLVGLALGTPSALSLAFFHNQDWVWGLGLILSGLFYALGARKFGLERLRRETVNGEGADIEVGGWWNFIIGVVVPIEAVILMIWWLWEARGWNPQGWLNPFLPESVGTVLVQWGVALVALLALQRWLYRNTVASRGGES